MPIMRHSSSIILNFTHTHIERESFPSKLVGEPSINTVYKSDMCFFFFLITCEFLILFIPTLSLLLKKYVYFTCSNYESKKVYIYIYKAINHCRILISNLLYLEYSPILKQNLHHQTLQFFINKKKPPEIECFILSMSIP
jgi:hypothetical protein